MSAETMNQTATETMLSQREITPELADAVRRLEMHVAELYLREMERIMRTASFSASITQGGAISGTRYDAETERMLADLRAGAVAAIDSAVLAAFGRKPRHI